MAYINGNEILFSPIINVGEGGDDGGITLDDVDVENVAVNTAIAGGVTGVGKGTILRVTLTDGEETKTVNHGMTTDPITADVIKSGVNILGVTGTLESGGIELADVSVSSVAVNTSVAGGVTGAGKGSVLRVQLTDGEETKTANYFMTTDPITADIIKKGKNVLGITGTLETGSGEGGIALEDVRVVDSSVYVCNGMPTYLNYLLTDGTNTTTAMFIMANTDPIIPSVIKKGVNILGVTGTLEAGSGGGDASLDSVTVSTVAVKSSSGGTELTIVFTDGENTKFVTYTMPSAPITADVIKKGVTILGVKGTYEGELTGRDIVDVNITEV